MKEYQVSNMLVNNMSVSKEFSRDDFLELLFHLDLDCCKGYRFKVSVIPLFEEVNGYNGKGIVIKSIDFCFKDKYLQYLDSKDIFYVDYYFYCDEDYFYDLENYSLCDSYIDLFYDLFDDTVCRGNGYFIDHVDGNIYHDSYLFSIEKII